MGRPAQKAGLPKLKRLSNGPTRGIHPHHRQPQPVCAAFVPCAPVLDHAGAPLLKSLFLCSCLSFTGRFCALAKKIRRSEERRVGKECRDGKARYGEMKGMSAWQPDRW